MRFYTNWIERAFGVIQKPGVSRAWRRTERDGTEIILTDLGGFDLPNRDGPFCAIHLDGEDRVVAGPKVLYSRLALAVWLRQRSTCPIPTDPRL